MSHYQKLTAVVMGHIIADDRSSNGFPTSVHIVITSIITTSASWTSQPSKTGHVISVLSVLSVQQMAHFYTSLLFVGYRWRSRFFTPEIDFNDASSFHFNMCESLL